MENGCYNKYTISDSEDSMVITENCWANNVSLENDVLSSTEGTKFFSETMPKRKQSLSPEISPRLKKHKCPLQKNVCNEEGLSDCIDNFEPDICKPNKQKSVEIYNSNTPESDIHINTYSSRAIDKIEPKRKKRLTKEESEEKKKEEKAQREAKKKLNEELKRLNPKECLKYITVHIDINLWNRDYSEQIRVQIQSTNAKYKIESNSIVSHSITWSRQISDTISKDENFMLIIWDFENVKNLILSSQLIEKMNHLKLYKTQLSLIIYSTKDQLKKAKFKKKNELSWSDMLNSLEQMMLSCHVSFRFIENKNDIGIAIFNFTKSIAQKPYKLNKYKEEQDGCDWYASGHTKNCVTIDKNGNGLTQLWRQMLSQFPLCALETSEAISSIYRSPVTLLEAYDKCSSRLEGETLLQDISVRRGFGPLASNRRIGPELSKKIYTFFMDNTGCTTLSQE